MGYYLDDAKAMYRHAMLELETWRQSEDEIVLRDASEKVWGAITQATNELLQAYDRPVPSGTGARRSGLNAIERQHRQISRLRMRARFMEVENVLHKECFYDGYCPLPLVTDVIEDAREYLDDVEALSNGQLR